MEIVYIQVIITMWDNQNLIHFHKGKTKVFQAMYIQEYMDITLDVTSFSVTLIAWKMVRILFAGDS